MEILRRVDPARNGGVLLAGVVLDQMHLNYLGRSTNLLHDPPGGYVQRRGDPVGCTVGIEASLLVEVPLPRQPMERLQVRQLVVLDPTVWVPEATQT